MFCSTIIPTIGRASLAAAVASVLDQAGAVEREVIVVNDSGVPLPPADWQRDPRVRILETQRRERSVARNTGAAVARGKYLHFLDDDDILLPGALETFAELIAARRADWYYGGYDTIDDEGRIVAEYRPEPEGNVFPLLIAGEGIPLQASLLDADAFFAAGGFDPRFTTTEDRDLGRRMALRGDVARTPLLVARIRIGEVGSSTRGEWERKPIIDRLGREKALSEVGAFQRLTSANPAPFWRGRVARNYVGSAAWNLRRNRFSLAVSRMLCGIAIGLPAALNTEFWRGLAFRLDTWPRGQRPPDTSRSAENSLGL